MKKIFKVISVIVIFSFFTFFAPPDFSLKTSNASEPSEYILVLKPSLNSSSLKNQSSSRFKAFEKLDDSTYKITFDKNQDIKTEIEKLKKDESVQSVSQNLTYKATALSAARTPNDPYLDHQYYLYTIGAPTAWSNNIGDEKTIIAVIDTGIDLDHPDLKDNIWNNSQESLNGVDDDGNGYVDDTNGWDWVNNNNNPRPESYNGIEHGTHVAGIAAAKGNNSQGVSGVCWNCKIMPLQILDGDGNGTTENLVKAINYALDKGAAVINLSLVADTVDPGIDSAIRNAYDRNVPVVAAAGNSSKNLNTNPISPISNDLNVNAVIGVASTDTNNNAASYSNYGSSYVDISAPGTNIFSTLYYNGADYNAYYGHISGTSQSAPMVSGTIALLKSRNPNYSNSEIKNLVRSNRLYTHIGDNYGGGVINTGSIITQTTQGDYRQKIGILKNERGDQNFYIYNSPQTFEPQDLTGYDLWNIPSGNNVVAVIGIDHDGDGKKSVGVLKNEGGDYNFYVYEAPQGPQPTNIIAADYWNIPMFNSNTISICALDHNGDGRDEVGVLANEGGDYNFYVFNAPRTFEATDIVAKDLWNIPRYNQNTFAMVGVDYNGDGRDEVGILANESGDYNFYVFNAPQGVEATNIVAADYWNIPRYNQNNIAMAGIDVNGDARDEIGILANEGGDYNFYVFETPQQIEATNIIAADRWNIPSGDNGIFIAPIF
jgi:subtilisin family serine protease